MQPDPVTDVFDRVTALLTILGTKNFEEIYTVIGDRLIFKCSDGESEWVVDGLGALTSAEICRLRVKIERILEDGRERVKLHPDVRGNMIEFRGIMAPITRL